MIPGCYNSTVGLRKDSAQPPDVTQRPGRDGDTEKAPRRRSLSKVRTEPGAQGPSAQGSTIPALLERPKLSNAMARHIVMERECKRQEEEESLEETKEQILKLQEKLLALQEEKHQLFLQLKKVLHEEEKRRLKEQSDLTTLSSTAYQQSLTVHTGTLLLSMQGSPGGHNRPGILMAADMLTTRHYVGPAVAFAGTPEDGQFQGSPDGAYGTAQPPPHYGPTQPAYSPSRQLRAPSSFPAPQPQPQPQPCVLHGHFQPTQTGFLRPGGQTGFSDSSSLRPMNPQAPHPAPGLLAFLQLPVQMQPAGKSGFAATSQPGPWLLFLQHSQNLRFYHK
uniref:G protein pathway suppressor 2 n=1 Tax=Mandrillus leucophaeus TaxID=9568 RepID=A0A2K6A693_MANLE